MSAVWRVISPRQISIAQGALSEVEQQRIRDAANRKRSEAAQQRERKPDGTLASSPTTSGNTGSTSDSDKNVTSAAKAKASGTNRGAVERMGR